jgi:hypothetical protein
MDFEDADIDLLKNLVKNMKWAFIHKEIIKFNDYIENL